MRESKQTELFKRLSYLLVVAFALLLVWKTPTEAVPKKTVPAKTTITKISVNGTNKVSLKWTAAKGATSYHVYYKQKGAKSWKKLVSTAKTAYTHVSKPGAALVEGKTYLYMVRTYNNKSKKWGAESAAKPVSIPYTPGQAVIKSVKKSGTAIRVTWGKVPYATSYTVYCKKSGAKKWTKRVTTTSTSYSDKGTKQEGASYLYTIRAYSNKSKKYGTSAKAKSIRIPYTPETVTMKEASARSYNKVYVSWEKAQHATAYDVYYKKSGAASWTKLTTTKNTSYTHTGSTAAPLEEKATYLYTVRSYNGNGDVWCKKSAAAKAVKIPRDVTKIVPEEAVLSDYSATGHSITLTWKKATDATSYVLYGKKEKTDAWRILGNTDKTSFTVSSINGQELASGTSYWFHICSYNKNSRKYGTFDSDGGMEASTDEVPATGIKLSTWDVTLTASHKTETIQAELIPADATAYEFEFQMDDPSIAEITAKQVNGNKASVTIKAKKNGNTALYIIHGGLAETCDVTVNTDIAVSGVKLNKTSLTFKKKGEQEKLTASIQPASATNQGVVWSSDNPKTATVDANGTVTAVGPGTATITVTTKDGNKTASCQVTADITLPIESIKLNVGEVTLGRYGASETLHATVYPAGAKGTLVWTSSNEQIATVDQQGKVTAVSTGNAVITVSTEDGSVSATCDALIEIDEPAIQVERVTLNHATASLTEKGETLQLTASLSPEDATEKTVLWKSSRPSCATVDGSGLVTAVSSGTATITAMAANGVSATCEITVSIDETVHVSSIQLDKATLSFTQKGASETLQAIILPSNADDQSVSWTSSNSSVAKVSQDGTVTAVSNGTAVITAIANDGRKAATCSVTVKIPEETKPEETFVPRTETITLAGGETADISVAARELKTISVDFPKVEFSFSGDTGIFEIYEKGSAPTYAYISIEAYRAGTVKIAAKYNGTVLKYWNVTITSDWADYWEYVAWRKSKETEIWTSDMTLTDKLDAAKAYIKTNFKYKAGSDNIIYAYKQGYADCITASELMGDFAKDLGCTVGYYNMYTQKVYKDIVSAYSASDGHIYVVVDMDGNWVAYDAQP